MNNVATNNVNKSVQQVEEFKVPQDPWAYVYAGLALALVVGSLFAFFVPFLSN